VSDTELIDEIKAHLPIPAYAGRDLCRHLLLKGKNITPETELKIIEVIEYGEEGGIVCCLDAMLPDALCDIVNPAQDKAGSSSIR
jgi:hypothetical protein